MAQQSVVDSLERILPGKKGKERLNIVGELSYQYCYINTNKALSYGKEELKLAIDLKNDTLIAQAHNDIGAAYLSKGDFKKALPSITKALNIREKLGDSVKVANTLINVGYAYQELGDGDKALKAYFRAARIYDEEQKQEYLSTIYNNIGAIYLRQSSDQKAIEYLNKAIEYSERFNDINGVINAKTNLGGIAFGKGDFSKSEQYYLEALEVIKNSGIENKLAIVLMNLGDCNIRLGNFEKGRDYLLESIPLYEEKQDFKGLGMVLVNTGVAYLYLKDLVKAEEYLLKGKRLCEQTESNIQLYFAYEALYSLELAKGNNKKAMLYFNEYKKYGNLVQNAETTEKLAEMEVKYQTEKKEKELALRNTQLRNAELTNRKNQLIIISLVLSLLLILTIAFFVFRNNRLKRERLLQQSQLDLQEERLRISRDLHDNIGAELTLISSSLDAKAFHSQNEKEKSELENISSYSRNAMSQLRETIWAIRSESNSLYTFTAKLREYSQKLCSPKNIESSVTLIGESDLLLSPTKTINLYRLCQEAVHNAVKHSNCTQLNIEISEENGRVQVKITDNGKGFDQTIMEGGNGLSNMESRARELGGKLEISSIPGEKTLVDISF